MVRRPTPATPATLRAALLGLLVGAACAAQDAATATPRVIEYPWMSVATWNKQHEQLLARAKEHADAQVVFLGDSITAGWNGNAVWKEHYAPLHALNLGIGGDDTENVLWRITGGGELAGLAPKAVVLLIGTNNLGNDHDQPADVVRGVAAVLAALRQGLPQARILLLGVFPRDANPKAAVRGTITTLNEGLAKLADGKAVHYLDIGSTFLAADGGIAKDIMPDALHLSEQGYRLWAAAMRPALESLLAK